MKKVILLGLLALTTLVSCTPEAIEPNNYPEPKMYEVAWDVYEQSSVSHFEVEASSDGRNFDQVGAAMASTNQEETYVTPVDLRNYMPEPGLMVYVRIKNIDIDGKFSYSAVQRLYSE